MLVLGLFCCRTRQNTENYQVYRDPVDFSEDTNLSANQIIYDILQKNSGKLIYVDFWATDCGPCLAEMPNSKIVEHEFENMDVVFVYICLGSKKMQWEAVIDKFQLGGQHYLLSNKQSSEMREFLKFIVLPFYMLVDKNGVVKYKGSHLRPLVTRDKIKEMLK